MSRGIGKSHRFLDFVSRHPNAVVMAHDNPDPDAIASGWALTHLIHEKLGRRVRFVAGGEIVRAENRALVSLLKPPLELEERVTLTPSTLVILADCSAEATNHPHLSSHQPLIVVDHHLGPPSRRPQLRFQDLRPEAIATATLAGSYLREQRVSPPPRLATALLYAIRTESKGGESHYSPLDHSILTWLTRRANPGQLAQIEDAPLAFEYFSDLALALQSTVVYGDAAFCLLPQTHGPEIVGEVADLLLRCEAIESVLCGAYHGQNLVLSVRTDRTSRKSAVKLTLAVLRGLGHGGGHFHRAGGIIRGVSRREAPRMAAELRRRWRTLCGGREPKAHLVSRTSIRRHL